MGKSRRRLMHIGQHDLVWILKVFEGHSWPELKEAMGLSSEKRARTLFAQGLELLRPRIEAVLDLAAAEEGRDGGADTQILVRRVLERVPEELQDVAIYYYVDDLSHDEIATIVGVSRRTVGNRLATFHAAVSELLSQGATP